MNAHAQAERSAAATAHAPRPREADSDFQRLMAKPMAPLRRMTGMLADRLGLRVGSTEEIEELIETLKATAFRQREQNAAPITDAQMLALLIIANEYGLNPWTKEIYAFPDRGGIQPIVGYDGWVRIINEHPQFDGIEFDIAPDGAQATCRIFRKDRTRPTEITEFLTECKRGTEPWSKWPRRMIRNKSVIQCARLAFGFALQDDEEGAIAAGVIPAIERGEGEQQRPAPAPRAPELPPYSAADFDKNLPAWRKLVESGKKTAADLLAMLSTKAAFSEEQRAEILALKASEDAPVAQEQQAALGAVPAPTFAQVADAIVKARSIEELEVAGDAIGEIVDEALRGELRQKYDARRTALEG